MKKEKLTSLIYLIYMRREFKCSEYLNNLNSENMNDVITATGDRWKCDLGKI